MNESRRFLEDVFEWDVINWSVAARFWERRLHGGLSGARALEIGARNGGLSLWLAWKGAHVICSDVSGAMDSARDKHRPYNVLNRISYEKIDARYIPYEDDFDIVAFKSLLGGVRGHCGEGAHFQVMTSILKSLKPGGQLLFAENLEGCFLHRYARKKFIAWGRTWKYLDLEEMSLLFKGFAKVDFITCGFTGCFGRSERQRRVLGTLDKCVFNKVVPSSWRYIVIGVASKSL